MFTTPAIEASALESISFINVNLKDTADAGHQAIVIENELSKTVIALYGAHVLSFVPKGKPDLLWMCPNSTFVSGSPIRGGIPLCLPWFGPRGEGEPIHGFCRINVWGVTSVEKLAGGKTKVTLTLSDSDNSKDLWPFAFTAVLEVTCGTELEMSLSFQNRSEETKRIECAFHTYFNVGSSDEVNVEGFDGCPGINRLDNDKPLVNEGLVEFGGAITRYLYNCPAELFINSPNGRIRIETSQKSCMFWNPGEAAATVPDIGVGLEKEFVCVEPADAIDTAVELAPTKTYSAKMKIGWC